MRNAVQRGLRRAIIETLESRRLLSISVNAANEWWDAAQHIGGVNIGSHSNWNNFVDGKSGGVTIPFQADADAANIPLIRTNAYPDIDFVNSEDNSLTFFDGKVQAILNSGAQPLLISYTKPGLKYYNVDGTLNTGGTYATNLVWLVKHYMAAPFNLQKQYWEIGNEPESTVDYKVSSWVEYAQIYRECHEALVAAGLRDKVVLGAAVTAGPYLNDEQSPLRNNMHRYMLAANPDAINWMSWHSYVGTLNLNNLLNEFWKVDTLNNVHRTIHLGHTANGDPRDWADAGLAALMAQYNLTQPDVGIAITETNTWNTGVHTNHTLQSGLWHLATSSLMLQNPLARANNLFIFDDTNVTGLSVYNTSGQKDYTYWSLYMLGNYVGNEVLQQVTTGNNNPDNDPYLLVTATKDSNYVYLQVINRKSTSITDTVSLSGVNVTGQAMRYVLSATATPNNGTPVTFTSGAQQTFAGNTATVFKIPYSVAPGYGLAVDDSYKMVAPGGTRRYTITVQRQGGFSGAVTPTIAPPAGITASVTHAGGDTWYVDLTPSSAITPGAYYLTAEANVSGQTARTPLWLVVAKPDFRVEPAVFINYDANNDPFYRVSVAAGNTALARISVIPSGGFTGTVNLSVTGLPPGATPSGLTSVTGAGYSLMEIHVPAGTVPNVYAVTVTGTSGAISHSKTFHLTVTATGTNPNAPSSLAASVIAGKAVRLNWADNSNNETSFSIERSTNGTTFKEIISYSSGDFTGYTDVAVQPGQTYWYRIRAFNSAGTSAYATSAPVTVASSSTPAAPTNLVATPVSAGQINLSWNDNSSNETNFVIERATNSSFTQNLKTYTPAANSTAFADVLLSGNTTYYFRIKATNGSGSSAYSNTVSAATLRGQSIRFETSEGYNTTGGTGGGGNIVGQPSTAGATKWSGSALFNVLSGVGSGGQGIRSTTSSFAAYSATTYTPAAVDFQGATAPVTSGFSGVVGFSFDMAVNTALNNSSSAQAWDFLLGNNALEFLLMANGKLNIQSSAGNFNAKTTPGGATDFDFDNIGLNQFVRLSGEIDYGSKTFTLYVNYVQQKTPAGATNIPFRNGSAATHFDTIRLQTRAATTSSDYVRITADNLTFSQVSSAQGFAAMSTETSKKRLPHTNTAWVTLANREEERRKRQEEN